MLKERLLAPQFLPHVRISTSVLSPEQKHQHSALRTQHSVTHRVIAGKLRLALRRTKLSAFSARMTISKITQGVTP